MVLLKEMPSEVATVVHRMLLIDAGKGEGREEGWPIGSMEVLRGLIY